MTNRNDFSVINLFITGAAENPVSHKYVVAKGSKTFIALMHLDSLFSQAAESEEVYVHETCLSRNRHTICL
jgi:hypothetical protein